MHPLIAQGHQSKTKRAPPFECHCPSPKALALARSLTLRGKIVSILHPSIYANGLRGVAQRSTLCLRGPSNRPRGQVGKPTPNPF